MLLQTKSTTDTPILKYEPRREADHRIANSFQIVSALVRQRARSGAVADPHTFLMEIADRIDTVGKLHILLSRSPTETVQLRCYLNEICDRLTGALAPEATRYTLDCPEDCPIAPRKALPLALMVAELISNSLKYAHPSGLPTAFTILCRRVDETGLEVVYEDDGVGFPEDFDMSAPGHMGMRLIQLLSQSIPGVCNWRSDPLGIRFEIAIADVD